MHIAVGSTLLRRAHVHFTPARFSSNGARHPFQSIHEVLSQGKVPSDALFRKAIDERREPPLDVCSESSSSWDNAILSLYTSCQRVDPDFGSSLSVATYHRLVLRSRRAGRQQKSPARALLWHRERSKHRDHTKMTPRKREDGQHADRYGMR